MRAAWIDGPTALKERLQASAQISAPAADAEMPPYMESFLAHLRLLVGVPFDYLVPDSRLLPTEAIRFFYLDRSWIDRLVDGAIAVGKIGSREQAHHQAQNGYIASELDHTERSVRDLQRRRLTFEAARGKQAKLPANLVTGFVLRSAAVSGWPHMDVRAYAKILPRDFDPDSTDSQKEQLRTLRLERLAPAVMIALFEGVPRMVICEEPHHGIQFGIKNNHGDLFLLRRDAEGTAIANSADVDVPMRAGNKRVLHLARMRRNLADARATSPAMPSQNGSGAFAVELLSRPWRQRFQGAGGRPDFHGDGRIVAEFKVIQKAIDPGMPVVFEGLVK